MFNFSGLDDASGVEDGDEVRIFERDGCDFLSFEFEMVAATLKRDFSESELGRSDEGEAIVSGGVEERGLLESFEKGLTDDLHY
jgi:hypothetical protein